MVKLLEMLVNTGVELVMKLAPLNTNPWPLTAGTKPTPNMFVPSGRVPAASLKSFSPSNHLTIPVRGERQERTLRTAGGLGVTPNKLLACKTYEPASANWTSGMASAAL